MSKNKNKIREYISLAKAAELCEYSQDYLSLRARNKKLRAKKLGRNWFTTIEWLEEYSIANGKSLFEENGEVEKSIKSESTKDDGVMSEGKKEVSDSKAGNQKFIKLKSATNDGMTGGVGRMDGEALLNNKGDREKASPWTTSNKINRAEFLKKIRAPFSMKLAVGMIAILLACNAGLMFAGFSGNSAGRFTDQISKIQIKSFGSGLIAQRVKNAKSKIASVRKSVKNGLEEIAFAVSDGAGSFKTTYDEVLNHNTNLAFIFVDGISSFKDAPNDFTLAGRRIAVSVRKEFNVIKMSAGLFADGVKTFGRSNARTCEQVAEDLVASVGDQISNKYQNTKSKIASVADSVKDNFGKDYIRGF